MLVLFMAFQSHKTWSNAGAKGLQEAIEFNRAFPSLETTQAFVIVLCKILWVNKMSYRSCKVKPEWAQLSQMPMESLFTSPLY